MKRLASGYLLLISFFTACSTGEIEIEKQVKVYEQITYTYAFSDSPQSSPYRKCITYFFENGKPHRWTDIDSTGKVLTDYVYRYDENWKHVGAIYREPGEEEESFTYAVELVSYSPDSLQKTTSWVDEQGEVYYRMVSSS